MNQILSELTSAKYDAVRRMSYVALDVGSWEQAAAIIDTFGDAVDGYKLGLELFHAEGPRAVERLCEAGKRVFLDVKLHDIPNTVAGALRSICQFPIEMVNVHALGGTSMMAKARETVDCSPYHPLLIAVTVLTSLTEDAMQTIGFSQGIDQTVTNLVKTTMEAGLDGVVSSALEAANIARIAAQNSALNSVQKSAQSFQENSAQSFQENAVDTVAENFADKLADNFEIVVPGTRPVGSAKHDQARTLTPGEALQAGATRLVLGRAVTQTEQPLQALQGIWGEMITAIAR